MSANNATYTSKVIISKVDFYMNGWSNTHHETSLLS